MTSAFTEKAANDFALLSGDHNPLHLDAMVARRLMFGRPVAHGIHVALWALDRWLAARPAGAKGLTHLKAQFKTPVPIGAKPALVVTSDIGDTAKLRVEVDGLRTCLITVTVGEALPGAVDQSQPKSVCRERLPTEIAGTKGNVDSSLDPSHLGFLGYGISLVAFVIGLRELGTARTGAYFSTAPFVGAIVSVLLLGESITLRLVAAATLMGVGVWLHLTDRHEHEHEHDHHHHAMEHEHAHEHDEHHHHHGDEPPGAHVHPHRHEPLIHQHPHFPDAHHRHGHG